MNNIKEKMVYLLTHNKNYTKKQYEYIQDVFDYIEEQNKLLAKMDEYIVKVGKFLKNIKGVKFYE